MTKYWQIDSAIPTSRKYRNNNFVVDLRWMEKYGLEMTVTFIRDKFIPAGAKGAILTKKQRDLYRSYAYGKNT